MRIITVSCTSRVLHYYPPRLRGDYDHPCVEHFLSCMHSYIVCGRKSFNLPKKKAALVHDGYSSALTNTLPFLVEFFLILVFNLFSKPRKADKYHKGKLELA